MNKENPYTHAHSITNFDDQTIRALFGSLDAEQEDPSRFAQLFVTNRAFDRFKERLPIRIAVGNKGTGKTAFIRRLYDEMLHSSDVLCAKVDPILLMELGGIPPTDSTQAILHWKRIFARIAASVVLTDRLPSHLQDEAGSRLSSVPAFLAWLMSIAADKTKGGSDIAIKKTKSWSKVNKITFFLDDLDAGYDGTSGKLRFINEFLMAARYMIKENRDLQFRISLRWDIYDLIERANINPEFDKIRYDVIHLAWSNHDCYVILAYRVSSFFGEPIDYVSFLRAESSQEQVARYFDPILEPRFIGKGKWENTSTRRVLLSLTRRRPRDLISLLSIAARNAAARNSTIIRSSHLNDAFPTYSNQRLADIVNEFKARLPQVETLLRSFMPPKRAQRTSEVYRYTNDRLVQHLKQFLSNAGADFHFSFSSHKPSIQDLIDFLFRSEFLQAYTIDADGYKRRYNFDQVQQTSHEGREFGFNWEVHTAYRWALQPTTLDDVFNTIDDD